MVTYKIKRGDTLSKIAEKFNTTVKDLADLNHIPNVDRIKEGDVLKIPTETNGKDYSKIGKQFEKCLVDIENLPSVKELCKML